MNENIDLTKILEGCEGIELYSPLFGKIKLIEITNNIQSIICESMNIRGGMSDVTFTKEGFYFKDFKNVECVIFPSKDQRDWSKFVRPIKEGTPIMCRDKPTYAWILCRYKGFKDGRHYAEYIKNSQERWDRDFNYMIQFKNFDPNDIEGSLNYNIQK